MKNWLDMENKTKRIVTCDKCGTRYAFVVPSKQGVFRIECPVCKKETKFKVIINKNG